MMKVNLECINTGKIESSKEETFLDYGIIVQDQRFGNKIP